MEEMTSWIRNQPVTRSQPRAELDVVFQTSTQGFCSQFNQFFYHAYYARRIGKEVKVREAPNCISDTHPLLSSTFADVSGVQFVTEQLDRASPRQAVRIFDTLNRTPPATLKAAAREILRWHPGLEAQLQGILATTGLPAAFDLAVHIRTGDKITTGEMRSIPLDRYIRAIEEAAAAAAAADPRGRLAAPKPFRVFVMTDNATVLEQLKKRVKGPFEFYSLSSKHAAGGHRQEEFNARSVDDKFNEMMVFLMELYIAQRCPAIVATLTSNVGRFLWLTAAARTFRSMDRTDFVPL